MPSRYIWTWVRESVSKTACIPQEGTISYLSPGWGSDNFLGNGRWERNRQHSIKRRDYTYSLTRALRQDFARPKSQLSVTHISYKTLFAVSQTVKYYDSGKYELDNQHLEVQIWSSLEILLIRSWFLRCALCTCPPASHILRWSTVIRLGEWETPGTRQRIILEAKKLYSKKIRSTSI